MTSGGRLNSDAPASVLDAAAEALRAGGHDPSSVEALSADHVMAEVLGPWPRRRPPTADLPRLRSALATLGDAHAKLADAGDPDLHRSLGELAERVGAAMSDRDGPGEPS